MKRKLGSVHIKRLVLDVLKPHQPPLPEFATFLASVPGVANINVTLIEIDKETETLKLIIDGNLDFSTIKTAIEEKGGVIHSVDEVAAGSTLETERKTQR